MKSSIKNRHLIMIIVVILIGAGFFLQRHFIDDRNVKQISKPLPVGYKAEPDSMGWRPLFNGQNLTGWKITNFGPQGPIHVDKKEQAIILGLGDGCTGITWQQEFPKVNYEIELEAKRVRGTDFFCGLTFPVQQEHCTLIVGGWGGTVVGISNIDGRDASENFTSQMIAFEKQRWYHIRVKVTNQLVRAWIDNKQVAKVQVTKHHFSIRPEVRLSRPLGICSWMTAVALKNIQFRKLNSQ